MSSKIFRLNRAKSTFFLAIASISCRSSSLIAATPAAGHPGHRMHAPPAQHLDHVVVAHAAVDHLLADVHADFVDHAQDVALGRRRIRPHHEVRPAQGVEMRGVVGDVEGHVEHLAQFLDRRGRFDVIEHVQRLGRRHVVRFRADAADAVGDARHFFGGAAHAELLEAAQFRNLEIGVGDIALLVQEDLDLAVPFQAGDGIDGDSFVAIACAHATASLPFPFDLSRRRSSECAMLKR